MVDLKRYRRRDPELIQAFQYDINAPETPEVDEWEVVTCHPPVRDVSCVREGHDPFVVGAGGEIHPLKHGDWIVITEDHTR